MTIGFLIKVNKQFTQIYLYIFLPSAKIYNYIYRYDNKYHHVISVRYIIIYSYSAM